MPLRGAFGYNRPMGEAKRGRGREGATAEVVDVVIDKVGDLAFDLVAETNPRLEQMGLRLFDRMARRHPPVDAEDAVHFLNERELARMRAIEWTFVGWAAVAGALSGVASGVAELAAEPLRSLGGWTGTLSYHGVVQGVTIVATLAEVWALYWLGLRGVHDMAHAAGLPLAGAAEDTSQAHRAVALALARAALELPNPPHNVLGVNPHRELPRWRLVAVGLLYKLKITLSSFVLRALLKRAATRVGLRAWLAFVSAPVTAVWDALVARRVIREARVRAMGPSACDALLAAVREAHPRLSRRAEVAMARGVAAAIVRRADLHPNLVALLVALEGPSPSSIPDVDDTGRFLDCLPALDADERAAVLEVLVLAAVVDGDLARAEHRLVAQAAERAGLTASRPRLRWVLRRFLRGRALSRDALASVFEPAA